jgi:hypothetical protein
MRRGKKSMIYNKSTHPIEVKKISIRLWSLRDEIEAAIGRRMKECEAAGVPLFIEDIKEYYNLNLNSNTKDNVLSLKKDGEKDDDMNALMESIGDDVKSEAEAKVEETKKLSEAEGIIAEQASQGLETKKPNPILQRPYQRQAPDLDKVSYGFILLSDINMEEMLSFTKDKFLQGQSVVVEFLIPQNFMVTADVTYCHHYAMRSRIISSTKPDYRIQCKFSFSMKRERENLRNFLKSIEPTLPASRIKPKVESEEDSIDT